MKSKIFSLAKKIDNLIVKMFGLGWVSSYGYGLPDIQDKGSLKEYFIKIYFSSQPSAFKLRLFNVYIGLKSSLFVITRYVYRIIFRPGRRS